MTQAADVDEASTPAHRPPGEAPLSVTAGITAGGSLWWLGIVWGLLFVVFGVILVATSAGGAEIEDSLWQGVGAGWQRWVVLGAGVTMVPTFAPMLVTHGVTRRRLAQSAVVTMVLVALAGGVVMVAGYGIEDVVFGRNDWPHLLDDGEAIGGTRFLASVWMEASLSLAAYFATGWLIGVAFYALGRDAAVPLIVPCLVPAAIVELLLHSRAGNFGFAFLFDAFDAVGEPHAAVGVPATVVVLAITCAVATRCTRAIAIKA